MNKYLNIRPKTETIRPKIQGKQFTLRDNDFLDKTTKTQELKAKNRHKAVHPINDSAKATINRVRKSLQDRIKYL